MAVVFPYAGNAAWADGSGGGTPITAAKLEVIEDGVGNAHQQPAARVYHNATQSIPDNTETTVAFNSERFDQAGGAASTQHDTVTNNSRLTCRYAGIYLISANIGRAADGTGAYIRLRVNGTNYIAETRVIAGYTPISISTIYQLAVNDYVEVRLLHVTGAATNILASDTGTAQSSAEFMFARIA